MNRRNFTKTVAVAGAGMAAGGLNPSLLAKPGGSKDRLEVHLFSKHLQFLDYKDMAAAAKEMGFDGLDLTIRPKGHVLPENAAKDLPQAVKAIEAAGLKPKMFVSRVSNADDAVGVKSLEVAADLGFKYYRYGYFNFDEAKSYKDNLIHYRTELDKLAKINKRLGLHGAYQNHAGRNVGSYVTDLAWMLDGMDPRWTGCQYDIRHATVEGGTAWPRGLGFLKEHILTMPIKDFTWAQNDKGWYVKNVPLGEGMVDFNRFFKELRSYGLKPLVSLHCEYDLGGAGKGRTEISIPKSEVLAAMKKDLRYLHRAWEKSA